MFMEDCASGPCPRCGGTGVIPNGLWTLVPEVLRTATDTGMPGDQLTELHRLLRHELATGNADVARVRDRAAERAPATMPLLDLLRDPALHGVTALLGLLVGVAALLVSLGVLGEGQPVGNSNDDQSPSERREPVVDSGDQAQRDRSSGQKEPALPPDQSQDHDADPTQRGAQE